MVKKSGYRRCFISMVHLLHRKRGAHQGPTKKGKGTKIMVLTDEKSNPVSIVIASASIHEVKLVEQVIAERASKRRPRRITGDNAYDSDELDRKLKHKGVELNAPHRKGRRKPPTQDGRKLRAYKRRWKVERVFAWLFNFRSYASRYVNKAENFKASLLLASAIILFR
jgi:IS5 family transposase